MPESKLHKGDYVKFQLGTRPVHGLVREDRGAIGINGRHLYLVEFHAEPTSPHQVELPAEEMEVLTEADPVVGKLIRMNKDLEQVKHRRVGVSGAWEILNKFISKIERLNNDERASDFAINAKIQELKHALPRLNTGSRGAVSYPNIHGIRQFQDALNLIIQATEPQEA
ncbi:MAG TPA: hypothetical protein VKX17_15025 [Planctomycetota bacterium]|nr:hypothetical protein [Planctomycetota bacterium]